MEVEVLRRIVAVLAASALMLMGVHTEASAGVPKLVGTLKADASVFWSGSHVGGYVERVMGLPASVSASCLEAGRCYTWELRIAGRGQRLRVAIDVPERRDSFRVFAVDPKGTSTSVINVNAFDAELFVNKPMSGMWKVVVAPLTADYSTFKLRAKLEKVAYEPSKTAKYWAPNLVVPRLWEFGFVAPVTGLAGVSFDDANPPVDAAGIHPFSCTADETQAGAHRCLRFSFQLANAGPGNFDVRFNTTTNPLEGKMVQCVERPGKAPFARDAGEFVFHAAHGHYHYQDVVLHQLYRVTDRQKGTMTLAGHGEKLGYHPADQSFADWDKFVQGESGTSADAGNCYAGSNDQIGLSRGWGDAYRWQRPGNYVEFGDNGNGYYVVRTTADPKNHLLESSESDNYGYAYLKVVGEQVQILEQGRGTSPWDPHKVVSRW
jgi:hypothetical protein